MTGTTGGEYVVLVDEHDKQTGLMEKMQAHIEGQLHRAISVFIFNSKRQMLLQRRAEGKYHSAGLWTNACCSHPYDGETAPDAAVRRLQEEMGLTTRLWPAFQFIYKADMGNGLIEHEYDHVFIGVTNDEPAPAPDEVSEWKYANIGDLKSDIENHPQHYTAWFRICMKEHWQKLIG